MAGKDEGASEDGEAGKGAAKPASPMMLVIVGAFALFVAVLGAQVAAPLITNMISGTNAPAAAGTDEDIELAEGAEFVEPEPVVPSGPALYVPLDPPFVVSFNDEDGDTRFLQLTLQAMCRSEHAVAAIKTHAPALRNAFLFLISGYKVEELTTLEGKEKLRAAMLVSANDIMEKNTGDPAVEELFFTSLVIQ